MIDTCANLLHVRVSGNGQLVQYGEYGKNLVGGSVLPIHVHGSLILSGLDTCANLVHVGVSGIIQLVQYGEYEK